MILLNVAAIAAAAVADPASTAQPVTGDTSETQPDTDTDEENQPIVVTGTLRPATDVLGGVSVIDQDELAHDLKPSLGDTLTDMPGVSATSFGPTASRPILRGEQGENAPLLVDGISTLDLSASDPDQAVAINPITALRI